MSENTTPLITNADDDDDGGDVTSWWWKKYRLCSPAISEKLSSPLLTSPIPGPPFPVSLSCLECWAFELLVLLAGILPNSEITTSVIAMCVNTEAIAYMFTYGVSAAASTRVSNELGAKNIDRAKHAMAVTLKLSVILAFAVVLALGFGHDIWAGFFSNSPVIINQYASMTPLLVISIFLDSIQGVLSGVARGCGWQHLAVFVNLGMFYLIGMPVAIALAFLLKLYAKGLWIGLICGLSCQTGGLLLLVYLNKWTAVQLNGSNSLANTILV